MLQFAPPRSPTRGPGRERGGGMRVLILGAGRVGSAIAESLNSERTDITVVDTDDARLKFLEDRYDLGTVCGDASHPSVLERAGAMDAELLLAVTRRDEIN